MLLSPQEINELTGYMKPSAQMRWLTAQHIPYLVGGDGKPKVLRDPLLERLGGKQPTIIKRDPKLHLKGEH